MPTIAVDITATTAQAQTEIAKVATTTESTAKRVTSATDKTSSSLSKTSGAAASSSRSFAALGGMLGEVAGAIAAAGFGYLLSDVLGLPGPIANVVSVIAGFAPVLIESAGGLSGVITGVKAFSIALRELAVVQQIVTVAQVLWDTVTAAFPGFLIIAAIVAVVAVLVLLYTRVGFVRDFVNGAFRLIAASVAGAMGAVRASVGAVVGFFATVGPTIAAVLSGVAKVIFWPFYVGFQLVTGRWTIGGIASLFSGIAGAIGSALSGVAATIISPFQTAYDWILSNVIGPLKSVWNGVAGIVNSFSISTPAVTVLGKTVIPSFSWRPPQIPYLATGGVFNQATLAVVGEAGREVVAPEALLRDIVSGGNATAVPVNLNVYVNVAPGANLAEAGRQTVKALQAYVRANGTATLGAALGASG